MIPAATLQRSARAFNLVAGAWLFVSSFLWLHTRIQSTNARFSGLLIAFIAALGLARARWLRPINVLLGLWLVVSSFLLPSRSELSTLNHVTVGLLVTLAALIGRKDITVEGRQ